MKPFLIHFLHRSKKFLFLKIFFSFKITQARRDLNPHPPDLESGALPFELLAYLVSLWIVCFLQNLQYFLSSNFSCLFLFLVV
jgi:hypothetical protein